MVKEIDNCWLCYIVFDAGSSEEVDEGFKVSLSNQKGVNLVGGDLVLVEPLVARVKQAAEEHRVLGDELLLGLGVAHVAEHAVVVGVHLLDHTVNDVA